MTIQGAGPFHEGASMNDNALPLDYPTHRQPAIFWEELGRTVATFGFLEKALGGAIFALTITQERGEKLNDKDLSDWLGLVEKTLFDQLNALIITYANALNVHQGATLSDHLPLLRSLKGAASIRNVLCHASWDSPDNEGGCIPRFISRKKMVFESRVDVDFLKQVRVEVQHQILDVFKSVTDLGIAFPDSSAPTLVLQTLSGP